MTEENKDTNQKLPAFAERYGLVGQGLPVSIGPETRARINRLHRENDEFLRAGKDFLRVEQRPYGGTPAPGEPVSDRQFIPVPHSATSLKKPDPKAPVRDPR